MSEAAAAVDRTGWPEGPWDGEPDRAEWEASGLVCLARRTPDFGTWCGYVAVPPGHPWHGRGPDEGLVADVHGGLNWAGPSEAPRLGSARAPAGAGWLWFDCAHFGDEAPGLPAVRLGFRTVYRTLSYVRSELDRLAVQAMAAARGVRS